MGVEVIGGSFSGKMTKVIEKWENLVGMGN